LLISGILIKVNSACHYSFVHSVVKFLCFLIKFCVTLQSGISFVHDLEFCKKRPDGYVFRPDVVYKATKPGYSFVIMAALRSRCGHYIFALWFLSIFLSFFIDAVRLPKSEPVTGKSWSPAFGSLVGQ